jgi:hypothetical protein
MDICREKISASGAFENIRAHRAGSMRRRPQNV